MAAVTNVSNDLVWLLTRMSHLYANPNTGRILEVQKYQFDRFPQTTIHCTRCFFRRLHLSHWALANSDSLALNRQQQLLPCQGPWR